MDNHHSNKNNNTTRGNTNNPMQYGDFNLVNDSSEQDSFVAEKHGTEQSIPSSHIDTHKYNLII